MHARVRWITVSVLVVGCGLFAHAEEEGLETRLYRVGALTVGSVDHLPHAFPLVSPDMVSDEENPLFGAEAEEPYYPVGLVADLIRLIRADVAPAFWDEVDAAEIYEIHGQQLLLVHATPKVHAELEQFLATLERQVLSTVAIDVQTVRMSGPIDTGRLVLRDEDVAALLSTGTAGPALHFTALAGQRALALDGVQTAFLQDGDVEVNQKAALLDPITGVMTIGLSAAVRAMPSGDGRNVRLDVRALISELSTQRRLFDKQGFRYDLPAVLTTEVRTAVSLPAGAWAFLDGQTAGEAPSGWFFLVRATPSRPAIERRSGGIALPSTPAPPSGAQMVARLIDVADLLAPAEQRMAYPTNLVPSNFTPPEPPELPDAAPALSSSALVRLLVDTVAPASWEEDGILRPWEGRYLWVRNSPTVLDALERQLRILRSALLGSLITTLEVIDVPSDLAVRLASSGPRSSPSHVLSEDGRRLLATAIEAGAAHRIDGARVTSASGVRNHVASGRTTAYLQDYEIEVDSVGLPNPVFQNVFSGIVLDVAPSLTSDLAFVHLSLGMDRSRLEEPIRVLETPHGSLDLPTLKLLRVRSGILLPLGRTAIVAASGEGERRVLALLTVRWVPAE